MQSSAWDPWLAAQEARMGAQLRQTRDFVLTNARIHPGETVLDLGAGRGLLALAVAERVGSAGRVVGLDADLGCLQSLREASRSSTSGDRILLVHADAMSLPLATGTVDVVTTRSVLEFIPDKVAALREAYRVTRPGGRISCFETINRYLTRHHELLDLGPLGELGDQITSLFDAVYDDPNEPMLSFDERDLVRWFEEVGYVDVGLNFLLRWRQYQLTPEQAHERLRERGAANRPTILELVTDRLGAEAARRYEVYFVATAPRRPLAVRSGSAFIWGRKP